MGIKPLDSAIAADTRRPAAAPEVPAGWKRTAVLLVTAAINIVFATHFQPAPGARGTGLAVSVALAGVVAGLAVAIYSLKGPLTTHGWAIALLLLSSGSLVWLQPRGNAGLAAVTEALILLSARLTQRPRVLAGLLAAVFAALIVETSLAWHQVAATSFVLCLPLLSACVLAVLVQRLREAKVQAESLLAQVEANRGAEALAAALAERQHLAREMHDVLAHSLSGLMLQLEGVRLLARSGTPDPRLAQAADRAHELAKDGLTEARHAIGMLRDEQLPGPDALGTLTDQFAEHCGVPCTFTMSGRPHGVRPDARLALYRVTQEALTNIVKHADAERVEVRLDYGDEQVGLTIEDFADSVPAALPALGTTVDETIARSGSGYGLTGMRERAELLGGTLHAAATATGFRVELRVPA